MVLVQNLQRAVLAAAVEDQIFQVERPGLAQDAGDGAFNELRLIVGRRDDYASRMATSLVEHGVNLQPVSLADAPAQERVLHPATLAGYCVPQLAPPVWRGN